MTGRRPAFVPEALVLPSFLEDAHLNFYTAEDIKTPQPLMMEVPFSGVQYAVPSVSPGPQSFTAGSPSPNPVLSPAPSYTATPSPSSAQRFDYPPRPHTQEELLTLDDLPTISSQEFKDILSATGIDNEHFDLSGGFQGQSSIFQHSGHSDEIVSDPVNQTAKGPGIKQELKSKIQRKRRESGKSPIKVEYKSQQGERLTQADIDRRERRKASNRRAALKCRIKKKEALDAKEMEAEVLRAENETLRKQIEELRACKSQMVLEVTQHQEICPLGFTGFTG